MKIPLTLTMALALSASAAAAQSVDISRMEAGKPPDGFVLARTGKGAPGSWVVVEEPGVAGGRAIAPTSADRTDYRFPLAILPSPPFANLEARVRFKAVGGTIDRAGGIAVRLADANNYYVARANALEDNVRFYRVVKGNREELAGANLKVSSGEWHELVLRAEGERFTVGFDGETLFTATDRTFVGAGRVALWAKADCVTSFADIDIKPLP